MPRHLLRGDSTAQRLWSGTVEDVRRVILDGQFLASICHIRYYVILLPWVSALLLHCKPGVKCHGVLAVVPGAGLAHVRRVGVVGNGFSSTAQPHVPRYQSIQSVGLSVSLSTVRPSAQGHLASRSNIRHSGQLCFSGRQSWNLLAWDR